MSNLKKNATSFKNGREKTGGRKAGTPNKTTLVFREVVLNAAEAAGNEVGDDGVLSYLTRVALHHPPTFIPLLARSMPQQLESQQTAPPEEKKLRTAEEALQEMRQRYGPLDGLVLSIFRGMTPDEKERVRQGWSFEDRFAEDDVSQAPTRAG